jgi:hypothetical protein
VYQVARSYVEVGSFHARLFRVGYFAIVSVREVLDTPLRMSLCIKVSIHIHLHTHTHREREINRPIYAQTYMHTCEYVFTVTNDLITDLTLTILWNPYVHYGVNRVGLLEPILCHFSPEYIFIYFSKIYFNIIPHPRTSPKLFYYLYSVLNTVQSFLLLLRATCFSYIVLLSLNVFIFQSKAKR